MFKAAVYQTKAIMDHKDLTDTSGNRGDYCSAQEFCLVSLIKSSNFEESTCACCCPSLERDEPEDTNQEEACLEQACHPENVRTPRANLGAEQASED